MSHFLYHAPVHKPISGIGFACVGTCATERGESRDTPLGLGHLCRLYAQYARFDCRTFHAPKSAIGFSERSAQLEEELGNEYYALRYDPNKSLTQIQILQVAGEYVTKDAAGQERLHEERLKQRIAQVLRARAITQISPVTIFQHLLESFAGTGFERHCNF